MKQSALMAKDVVEQAWVRGMREALCQLDCATKDEKQVQHEECQTYRSAGSRFKGSS